MAECLRAEGDAPLVATDRFEVDSNQLDSSWTENIRKNRSQEGDDSGSQVMVSAPISSSEENDPEDGLPNSLAPPEESAKSLSQKKQKSSSPKQRQFVCRYGNGCTHILEKEHRAQFWHPPVPTLDGMPP
jgi:hypothetical protein